MDDFPEELREVVSDHWAQFPPQHPMLIDLFAIVFFTMWAVSFLANIGIVFIMITDKSLRTPVSTSFAFYQIFFRIQ